MVYILGKVVNNKAVFLSKSIQSNLWDKNLSLANKNSWGFYPCFNGIRVLTSELKLQEAELKLVSILVLMESGFLLAEKMMDTLEKYLQFLSLF